LFITFFGVKMSDLEKFRELCALKYRDQAIWVLNGAWKALGEKNAERVYGFVAKFAEFDEKNKAAGCELDELNAHRFLEFYNNTHTVRELRDKLREIGWDRRPMMFPLLLVLVLEFKLDWKAVPKYPQGCNAEALAEAQRKLDEVQLALAEAQKAEAEVKTALAEVSKQEIAREKKTKDLTEKSQGTGVKAGMAKQELAQHLAEDPLPLRKAKITLEAANRKCEKAVDKANKAVQEAEAALEALKAAGGDDAPGAIFFMERDLQEAKKYLPSSKGGVAKK